MRCHSIEGGRGFLHRNKVGVHVPPRRVVRGCQKFTLRSKEKLAEGVKAERTCRCASRCPRWTLRERSRTFLFLRRGRTDASIRIDALINTQSKPAGCQPQLLRNGPNLESCDAKLSEHHGAMTHCPLREMHAEQTDGHKKALPCQ